MHIIELQIENIKKIQVAQITPTSRTPTIGGKNRMGKSTALDSILYALGGGKQIPESPIRKGQKKGRIQLTLGNGDEVELIVERRFTKAGTTVSVTTADGVKVPGGSQTILDGLVGRAFDFDSFLTQKPAKQYEALRELLGLDFSDIEAERTRLYSQRTLVNHEAKQLEGQVEGMPEFDATEPVDTSDLEMQIDDAGRHNESIQTLKSQVESEAQQASLASQRIADCDASIEKLRQQAKELQQKKVELQTEVNEHTAEAAILSEKLSEMTPLSVSDLMAQLKQAEEINSKVAANAERKRLTSLQRAKTGESLKLTLQLENLDAQKAERLESARFPVPGLSFGDEQVLLNGLPLEQASQREQIELAVRMAFASNPKLKIAIVKNGSLLDSEALQVMEEIAEREDAEIWIERVGDSKECQIIFEDGLIVEDRTQEVA